MSGRAFRLGECFDVYKISLFVSRFVSLEDFVLESHLLELQQFDFQKVDWTASDGETRLGEDGGRNEKH